MTGRPAPTVASYLSGEDKKTIGWYLPGATQRDFVCQHNPRLNFDRAQELRHGVWGSAGVNQNVTRVQQRIDAVHGMDRFNSFQRQPLFFMIQSSLDLWNF